MFLGQNTYILFWICIIGLCMGSFFNVVILRSISGESIVLPASKCPKCNHKLYPWHNIPVLSYIFLRGKCAFCKEPISIQYPLVEIITMILYASCYMKFGIDIKTIFAVIICSVLVIISGTDIKEKVVDCNIPIGLAIMGIVYNYFVQGSVWDSILGLVAGALILEGLSLLGKLLFKKRAFGEADAYVAGALGACFGLNGIILVLIYSLVASMIFILPIFFYKQYVNNNKPVCISAILFTLAVLIFRTVVQNYFTYGLIVFTGVLLAVFVLRRIKTEENLTYLPLVPAFSLGALYYLFF